MGGPGVQKAILIKDDYKSDKLTLELAGGETFVIWLVGWQNWLHNKDNTAIKYDFLTCIIEWLKL